MCNTLVLNEELSLLIDMIHIDPDHGSDGFHIGIWWMAIQYFPGVKD